MSKYFIVILIFIVLLTLIIHRNERKETFNPLQLTKSDNNRIKLYIQNLYDTPCKEQYIVSKGSDMEKELIQFGFWSKYHYSRNKILKVFNKETIKDLRSIEKKYTMEKNILKLMTTETDSILWFDIPTLTKARYIEGKHESLPYAIIVRIRTDPHFKNIDVSDIDIPFEKKKNVLFWRGNLTGYKFNNILSLPYVTSNTTRELIKPSRYDLVHLWSNDSALKKDIDVGLVPSDWMNIAEYPELIGYLKQFVPKKDYLEYKYLLSIEGNDVATNLKWMLNSNSLVLMPRPRVESWFCESMLIPYVHFVPVKDDFSDLEKQKNWCEKNLNKCLEIIDNANLYVQQFLNEEKEIYICKYILDQYMSKVNIIVQEPINA